MKTKNLALAVTLGCVLAGTGVALLCGSSMRSPPNGEVQRQESIAPSRMMQAFAASIDQPPLQSQKERIAVDGTSGDRASGELVYPAGLRRRDPQSLAKPDGLGDAKELTLNHEMNPANKSLTDEQIAELQRLLDVHNARLKELQRQSALINSRWAIQKIEAGQGVSVGPDGARPETLAESNVVAFADGRSIAINNFRGESIELDRSVDDMWTEYELVVFDAMRFIQAH